MKSGSRSKSESLQARVGSAALGLLIGLAFGLVVATVVAGISARSFSLYVLFGSCAIGALVGFLAPSAAFSAVAGIAHALWGFIHGLAPSAPPIERGTPSWLKVVLIGGAVVGGLAFGWLSL